MRLKLAVGVLSASAIAYEILLMRLLSIVQWHHFAFLVISLALLGYGASGTLLTLARDPLVRRFSVAFPLLAAGFGVTSVGSFVIAQRLRLNPLEVMWDERQFLTFAAVYLILAVPFLCAGAALGLALVRFEKDLHAIYRADLVGAACGALGAVALLYALLPESSLRLAGLGGWLAAAIGVTLGDRAETPPRRDQSSPVDSIARRATREVRRPAAVLLLLSAGCGISLAWPKSWVEPRHSEYKAQAKALTVPGVEVLAERSSPLGEIAALRSPRSPFRLAPGLSLAFAGRVHEQILVFRDGEVASVVEQKLPEDLEYLDYLPASIAFRLLDRPRVALFGTGGGSWVSLSLRLGASETHVVETDAELLRVVHGELGDLTRGLYRDPRVRLHASSPRSFLAASRDRFDLIWLQLPGTGSPGAHGLRESYLETVQAVGLMLARLGEGGVLGVGGEIDAPPRASLKIVATVVEALDRLDLDPRQRVAMIRSWSSFLLLVRPSGWRPADLGVLRDFCARHFFDLVSYPGMRESEANKFNVLPEPALHRGVTALLGSERDDLIGRYGFDIRPARDERPFFFDFFRWRSIGELVGLKTRGGAALVEWGYVLLLAALCQATLAGLVLILLPLWLLRRQAPPLSAGRIGAYFLALGLAFLLLEVAFIQRLTLFLADPLRAAATVLGAFLFFAGLGSGASRRLEHAWGARLLPTVIASIACLGVVYLLVLPLVVRFGAGLPMTAKVVVVLLLLAPIAFMMGMPFPLGLRRVAETVPELLPWAWGVNGWASVLAAVLAVLLAVHFGFSAVIATGCGLYLIAGLAIPRHHSVG